MELPERNEVRRLVKYQRKNTRLVIDQAMVLGRLNKNALNRAGLSRREIQQAILKLRVKLKDYGHADK